MVDKPVDYMLKRWRRFAAFLDDGRICLTNNAAERRLGGFAFGRKAWLFAGSDRGADPTLGDAILDRIVHYDNRLKLTGESIRKKNAGTRPLLRGNAA